MKKHKNKKLKIYQKINHYARKKNKQSRNNIK